MNIKCHKPSLFICFIFHINMNCWCNYLTNLSSNYSMLGTIFRVMNLIHHQNWYSSIKQLLLCYNNLFAPKINHQKWWVFFKLFFKYLVQFYRIIFKCKKLHFSYLDKNYCVHILTFCLPVYFKHWAHIIKLLCEYLQLIVNSIPSLNKSRTKMLLYFIVVMPELNYLLTETIWTLSFLHLSFNRLFSTFFLWRFRLFFYSSLFWYIIFVQWILVYFIKLLILWKALIDILLLTSFSHWSQKLKFIQSIKIKPKS